MKDKEPKLEEIDVSHTLGGAVIHTQIRQSRGLRQTMSVSVTITDGTPKDRDEVNRRDACE